MMTYSGYRTLPNGVEQLVLAFHLRHGTDPSAFYVELRGLLSRSGDGSTSRSRSG
jgi:hypothetical protein